MATARNAVRRALGSIPAPTPSPTPTLDDLVAAAPDLVDRIFEYVVELLPEIASRRTEIKGALREEFGAQDGYIRRRDRDPGAITKAVLALFNGRNTYEVARRLNISPRSVQRYIKQAGDNTEAKQKLRQTSLEMARRGK